MDLDDGNGKISPQNGLNQDLLKDLFDALKIKHSESFLKEALHFLKKNRFFGGEKAGIKPDLVDMLSNLAFERKEESNSGIFYTPNPEVEFMCKYSMLEYLSRKCKNVRRNLLVKFIFGTFEEKNAFFGSKLWKKELQGIQRVLEEIKVLDPSCGSGVFLVGYLSLLDGLLSFLDKRTGKKVDPMKRRISIIKRSLFGVDVLLESILATFLHLFSWLTNENGQEHPSRRHEQAFFLERNFKVGDFLLEDLFSLEQGFDIVIGNPPYIRQEMILPPGKSKNDVQASDKKGYKGDIEEKIVNAYPMVKKLNKKCDYYVYFYFRGLGSLNKDGVLCFITSNSWLDADFGRDLQEFLIKYVPVISIVDSPRKSFEEADINTVIVTCGAPAVGKTSNEIHKVTLEHVAKFIRLTEPIGQFGTSENLSALDSVKASVRGGKINELASNFTTKEAFRVFPVVQEDLLRDGWRYPGGKASKGGNAFSTGKYKGNKWKGKYLNAHEIFYTILKKSQGKLVELGDLARIRAGCYSGINHFFYINDETISRFNIEPDFCTPIIRSSKDITSLQVMSTLDTHVLSIPPISKSALSSEGHHGVVSYIEWGEQQRTRGSQKTRKGISWPEVVSVKTRKYWYSIPENNLLKTNLFIQYISNDRFYCPFTSRGILSDRCFHRVFPRDGVNENLLAASLNSTFQAFLVMMLGRSNLGAGALKIETSDARKLFTLQIDGLSTKDQERLVQGLDRMGKRAPEPLFIECGLDPRGNIYSQEPDPLPGRQEIDAIVFKKLGLTMEEQKSIYRATCESVKQRLAKSRSIK